ncbi:conserved hypothetical protein [Trichophyton verrucosum HKI 0517]|uniref:Uncharacterized protein n=1 Tax=Trichophyton verrucosum (strain HKI 0517) TaxID=663202 RepID=D4D4Y8_TRIVH|nr:uncharacterized protein TRV_02156 [Trichophyton verrucosum HKI 0517]EFE43086.1 conserved hypothetical protein [Trichophyton verrucosum HKI 0517]
MALVRVDCFYTLLLRRLLAGLLLDTYSLDGTNCRLVALAPAADTKITSTGTDADKPEATANGDEKPVSTENTEKPAVETNAPAEDKKVEETSEESKDESKKEHKEESKEEAKEEAKEQPEEAKGEKETGQKRDHAAMSTAEPAATTADSKDEKEETKAEPTEPAEKKQKVEKKDEPVSTTAATAAEATENGNANGNSNGNEAAKRGPGRPKKSGGVSATPQKKKMPTPRSSDGVGSRTRSRRPQAEA